MERYSGGPTISRRELLEKLYHDSADLENDGTASVLYYDPRHGTCLAKGVTIVDDEGS